MSAEIECLRHSVDSTKHYSKIHGVFIFISQGEKETLVFKVDKYGNKHNKKKIKINYIINTMPLDNTVNHSTGKLLYP